MTESLTKHERNLSAIIHASTLSRFFIPLGNFILPLILWLANRKDLKFVDHNGKQALNFQISMFLYSVILAMIAFPFLLGLIPALFEGGNFTLDFFDHYDRIDLHFDRDYLNLSKFIWPVGIAGVLQGILFIVNILYTILATIRTNEGQVFTYPLTIPILK